MRLPLRLALLLLVSRPAAAAPLEVSLPEALRGTTGVMAVGPAASPGFGGLPVDSGASGLLNRLAGTATFGRAAFPVTARNGMSGGGSSLWDHWSDYWVLRRAEGALQAGKYEEARPHLAAASASSGRGVAQRASELKSMHGEAAAAQALGRLVRAALARDVFAREAALEQVRFWSPKDASAQLAAAREIWEAYTMPELLSSGGPLRDAAAVLGDLEAAAGSMPDRAAYQPLMDRARAGILQLPQAERADAARALQTIAARWNEAAAASLSLSFIRADRTAAAQDLQDALWSGAEAARVQNMAKELAHWNR